MKLLPISFSLLGSLVPLIAQESTPKWDVSISDTIADRENVAADSGESTESGNEATPQRWEGTKLIFISATVFDRSVTRLRWWHEGHEYEAFSNIDFNYMRPAGWFEGKSGDYLMLMGIGNEDSAKITTWREEITEEIPTLDKFPSGRSGYIPITKNVPAAAYVLLDELHEYFDSHKDALIAIFDGWEVQSELQAAWLKANPPKVVTEPNTSVWLRSGAPNYSNSNSNNKR